MPFFLRLGNLDSVLRFFLSGIMAPIPLFLKRLNIFLESLPYTNTLRYDSSDLNNALNTDLILQ
ncbi:MAG: hypothetical protein AAE984_03545 [Cuniculiplasma divulgatum]